MKTEDEIKQWLETEEVKGDALCNLTKQNPGNLYAFARLHETEITIRILREILR